MTNPADDETPVGLIIRAPLVCGAEWFYTKQVRALPLRFHWRCAPGHSGPHQLGVDFRLLDEMT